MKKLMNGVYITLLTAITYLASSCGKSDDKVIEDFLINKSMQYEDSYDKKSRDSDSLDHLIWVYRSALNNKPNEMGLVPVYGRNKKYPALEWLSVEDAKYILSNVKGKRGYTQESASSDSIKSKAISIVLDELREGR